jgi:hypothetical protein
VFRFYFENRRKNKTNVDIHTVYKQLTEGNLRMELFSVANEEVLCIDKFIGDENCGLLCSKFRNGDGGFDSARRLILRGNCLGNELSFKYT